MGGYVLSQNTKDRLNVLLNRRPGGQLKVIPPAPAPYFTKTWIVVLENDMPAAAIEDGVITASHQKAYVMERTDNEGYNDDDTIVRRQWNSEDVEFDEVFSKELTSIPAKDASGNDIPYIAIRDMLGTIWIITASSVAADTSVIAVKESTGGYNPVDLNGDRISYDTDDILSASVAPYISGTPEVGGLYLLQYMQRYSSWVVTAGDCTDHIGGYTPLKMTRLNGHCTDVQSGQILSGNRSDGNYTLSASYFLNGSTAEESDLFDTPPTITLHQGGGFNYAGAIVKPSARGLAVYQVIVTGCNAAAREVCFLSFKVIEHNAAPVLNPTIQWGDNVNSGLFSKNTVVTNYTIGTAADEDGDSMTLESVQWADNDSILTNYSLTITDGVVKLSFTTAADATGTATVHFRIDDGHDFTATAGTYPLYSYTINIT